MSAPHARCTNTNLLMLAEQQKVLPPHAAPSKQLLNLFDVLLEHNMFHSGKLVQVFSLLIFGSNKSQKSEIFLKIKQSSTWVIELETPEWFQGGWEPTYGCRVTNVERLPPACTQEPFSKALAAGWSSSLSSVEPWKTYMSSCRLWTVWKQLQMW